MFVIILRLLLIAAFFYLIYYAVRYIFHPKRKLELAHEQKKIYLYDDPNNVRKNFLVTYKGVLFEGEKYLGTTESAFEVVSIFIWPKDTAKLKGLTKQDFHFIEQKIREQYPNAVIDWKSPIKEFLNS
jgi:cbb3-type cytochrome oxidase subunit 3